jgi:hypothetical protein
MSAKKKTSPESVPAVSTGQPRIGRLLVIGALIAGLGGGIVYFAWRQVRDHVVGGSEYQVDPEKIAVTPPPPWIRSDVRAEALQDASAGGPLSLLDSNLTIRMASAFAAHPWVGRVERVSKRYPASVEVVVSYRKPVAMVEVTGGALPVDADGVVLPSRDFANGEAEQYPRIDEIHTTPTGPMGVRWADPAVLGGARIAAALATDWQSLGLFRVVPTDRKPARSGFEYEYVLYTRAGTRVDWGRAPSNDSAGELPLATKIARLREYVAQHGSLDSPDGPQKLRFGENGRLEAQRRAPVKPLRKNDPQPNEESRVGRQTESDRELN